eukprot:Gb_34895 [translate_table: standard]
MRRTLYYTFLLSNWKSSVLSLPNVYKSSSKSCFGSDTKAKIPIIHSFLQPSVFAAKPPSFSSPPPASTSTTEEHIQNEVDNSMLERELETALDNRRINDAWKAFKSLRNNRAFPSKKLINTFVIELTSARDLPSLKRAFATVVLLLEKDQDLVHMDSITNLVSTLQRANMMAPASTLIKTMLKKRCYPSLSLWSPVLEQMSNVQSSALSALEIFMEICQVLSKDNALVEMKPDTSAFNAALNACLALGYAAQAEGLIERMSLMGVKADGRSFGLMAQLYAKNGLTEKLVNLDKVMNQHKVIPDQQFYGSLVSGYLNLGNLGAAAEVVLLMLQRACDKCSDPAGQVSLESDDESSVLKAGFFPDEQIYNMLVKGFLEIGTIKDLAKFIIKTQEVEGKILATDQTSGAGIINACVNLGWLDKAHSILDEMSAQGAPVGLGVYSSLLKAYCKEQRTTEATQLVSDVNAAGLELNPSSYDAVIDVCMTAQDFKAAFALFRDMRESGVASLKTSYLTIMTGLTENHRPELMAAFLDEVVVDPRVEVGIHDWNSIIHSFCKLGRLEDARRTFKRMIFLRFEPNDQSYLSLVHGYCAAEKYFSVLLLWTEMRRRTMRAVGKAVGAVKFDRDLLDIFLYALVKGGFFDAAMEDDEVKGYYVGSCCFQGNGSVPGLLNFPESYPFPFLVLTSCNLPCWEDPHSVVSAFEICEEGLALGCQERFQFESKHQPPSQEPTVNINFIACSQ